MVVITNCESTGSWATINGTESLDTVDFKEGLACILVTGGILDHDFIYGVYDPAGIWDLSAEDHFTFWFKASEISDIRCRVYSGANSGLDYVEWTTQFLQQIPVVDTWYQVKLYKDDFDADNGAIDWSAVKAFRVRIYQTGTGETLRVDEIRIDMPDTIKAKIGTAGALDYTSDDVLELDIWGDDLKVGRWQMLLRNTDNKYGDRFHTNEASDIEINAATMMKGYVDDVFPHLDDRGVYTNNLKIMGRDYGRDLARLMYSAAFVDTKGDDLIDAILTAKGSEITYTSPSTAAVVNMERSRTYLIDWLQDVASRTNINYSAYVNQAKVLKFFALGTEDSGIALKSVAAALDNNILHLMKGEEIGFSIANVVELSAGSLKDHYSDGNALDYTEGANTTCVNEGMTTGAVVANAPTTTVFKTDLPSAIDDYYRGLMIEFTSGALDGERKLISGYVGATKQITVSPAFSVPPNVTDTFVVEGNINGISSIKFYCTINTFPTISLDFSGAGLYSHAGLDLSPPDEMSFSIRHNHPGVATMSIRPRLEDAAGNVIEFKRSGGILGLIGVTQKGKTDIQTPNEWHKVQVPIGVSEENGINASEKENKWYYTTEIDTFDWSKVVKIYFKAATPSFGAARIWMDNLIIPTVEVISIVEDAVSLAAYGRSEWFDQRNDIRNQIELSYAAASELEKRKDVVRNIKIIATGQIGIKYPGQTVTVQAPKHGIAAPKIYRIVSYHHQVRKNPIRGAYSFITTLDLVSDDLSPATQFVDPRRYMLNRDPVGAALEILALTRRRVRTADTTQRKEFGDTHPVSKVFYSGSGTTFPADPEDGFIFMLTGDIAGPPVYYGDEGVNHEYDEGTDAWIRGPVLLRRAAQPPVGGEVTGDTWLDTDAGTNGITCMWSGIAWDKIGAPSHDDIDDVGAGDHHVPFVSGDHALIEHLSAWLAVESRRWHSDFNCTWDEATPDYDELIWGQAENEDDTNATIIFGDDTTREINFGTEAAIPNGLWYLYWDETDVDGATHFNVKRTASMLTATGIGKGLLATIVIDDATPSPPSITPWGGYKPYVSMGVLAARSILAGALVSDFVIGDVEISTGAGVTWAPGGNTGMIITDLGLRGKGAAGAIMVELLSADGKITAGAGTVILDSSGAIVKGEKLEFQDAGGVRRGTIFGVNTGAFTIFSEDFILLAPGVNGVKVNAGPLFAGADAAQDFGKIGTRWDNIYAVDIWGRFHYTDMYMADTICPKCNQLFERHDELAFIVKHLKDYTDSDLKEIVCIPIHKRCNSIKLLRRWLECRLFGFKE